MQNVKRKSSKEGTNANKTAKKNLPESTTLKDFFYMIVLYVLKKCVYTPTHIKIGIYMIALLAGSLLKDFQMVPITYFSFKSNIFNLYFVRLGWLWTLLASTPWIMLTSCVYSAGNRFTITAHLTRTLIATGLWFLFTTIFDYIDRSTGRCVSKVFSTKQLCKANKYDWIDSIDISGDSFVLMYSLFYLLEEIKIYYIWDNIKNEVRKDDEQLSEKAKRVKIWFNLLTPYIKINFIFVSLFIILWEIMLFATFLYFHIISHKLFAAFAAIICWFLTYKFYYLQASSPGLPGRGSEIIFCKK